jgi:hypothetical protein
MTTADVETTKRRSPARTEVVGTLSGELLDAGSVFADRGLRVVRTAAESGLKVTDAVVLGTLGVAEAWATSTPFAPFSVLTVPPVKVARETWTVTRDGLRELVATV